MKKIPILAGMVVLQLVASYFILNSLLASENKPKEEIPVIMTTYPFAELIVNPLDSKGRRYFIADIEFVFPQDSISIPLEIEKRKSELIDTMMSVMMLRDISVLSTSEGREELRVDLHKTVEAVIGKEIGKLLFKKYLIQ
jgi:flagellar basal body-associated protein FliL